MGKHDKPNFKWEKPEGPGVAVEKISYDPPKNEWYEARIRTLEKENADLNRELEAMKKNVDRLYGAIAEMNETTAELDAENAKLKAALVRAALREV